MKAYLIATIVILIAIIVAIISLAPERFRESCRVKRREIFSIDNFKKSSIVFCGTQIIGSFIAALKFTSAPGMLIIYPVVSIPFGIYMAYMETKYIWGIENSKSIAGFYFIAPMVFIEVYLFAYALPKYSI